MKLANWKAWVEDLQFILLAAGTSYDEAITALGQAQRDWIEALKTRDKEQVGTAVERMNNLQALSRITKDARDRSRRLLEAAKREVLAHEETKREPRPDGDSTS